MADFIPFALPDIGEEEINEVVDSLRSGWITTGPKTLRFEKDFAQYIGAKYALAVNSATAGLHLALDAIGLIQGDRVITTTYTFTATAEVVRYFDAHPIFCDVEEKTLNIDCDKLEMMLGELCQNPNHRIKAIIPVHIAGQSCDMERISFLAKKYNLKVIEDAAHALPATNQGRLVGTLSDITVFSFYATKTLATGEGGMVVTCNDEYKKKIEVMRLHGLNRSAWDRYSGTKANWYYEIVAPGYKYNMTDIAASMGIHQLKKIDQFFERRNHIANLYNQGLKDTPGIVALPFQKNLSDKHSFHLYIIQLQENIRDKFIEEMSKRGIGLSVHFIPLHRHPYWKEKYQLSNEAFPVADLCFRRACSLPIYTKLQDAQVNFIIEQVKDVLSGPLE